MFTNKDLKGMVVEFIQTY